MDLLGKSIKQYSETLKDEPIEVFIDGNFDHLMYPSVFFRNYKNMNRLERHALQLCKGKILDIGAGAGCHSIYLQSKGFEVVAIDISESCVRTMDKLGVKNAVHTEIMNYKIGGFDTILLLMNGLGIAGNLSSAKLYLGHIKTLLAKEGKILLDSTDIRYTLMNDEDALEDSTYYGETEMLLKYKNKEEPLKWLYIDSEKLVELCNQLSMNCVILKSDSKNRFLATINCVDHEARP